MWEVLFYRGRWSKRTSSSCLLCSGEEPVEAPLLAPSIYPRGASEAKAKVVEIWKESTSLKHFKGARLSTSIENFPKPDIQSPTSKAQPLKAQRLKAQHFKNHNVSVLIWSTNLKVEISAVLMWWVLTSLQWIGWIDWLRTSDYFYPQSGFCFKAFCFVLFLFCGRWTWFISEKAPVNLWKSPSEKCCSQRKTHRNTGILTL